MENNIEQVLDAIKENFEITISDLISCRNIEINTHYVSSRESQELITSMEVHGFSDASMKAYGSCIYIVYRLKTGDVIVSLVAAKTKVSTIAGQTITKLELSNSLILTRLISNVKEAIQSNIEIRDIICLSDSQILRSWILKMEKMHKTFIKTRHDDYINVGHDCERANVLRVNAKTQIDIYSLIDISRFNFLRGIGFTLRFIYNIKAKIYNEEPMKGDLTTDETDAALNLLVRTLQITRIYRETWVYLKIKTEF